MPVSQRPRERQDRVCSGVDDVMRRLIALVSVALLVLAAGQAVSAQSAPTENECRPHIEKALKELTEPAVDTAPSQAEGDGDVAAPSSSEEDDVAGGGGEVHDADVEATPDDGESEESSVEMMQSDAAADETTDAAQGDDASQEGDSVEVTGDAAEGESVESAEETAEGESAESVEEAADAGSVESTEEATDAGSVESAEEATDAGSVKSAEDATDAGSEESTEEATDAGSVESSEEATDAGSVESAEEATDAGSVESTEEATDAGSVESTEEATDAGSVESAEEATDAGSVESAEEAADAGSESVEEVAEGESTEADDGDTLSRGRREATEETESDSHAEDPDSVEGDSLEEGSDGGSQEGDSNEGEDQGENQSQDASLEQADSGESAEATEGDAESEEEAGGEKQEAEGDDSVETTGGEEAADASAETAEDDGDASSEEAAAGEASSETEDAVDVDASAEAAPEGDTSAEVESTEEASSETEEAVEEAAAEKEAASEVEAAAESEEATEGDSTEGEASKETVEDEAATNEAAESAEEPEAAAEDAVEEAVEPAAPVDEEEAEPTPEEELSFDVDIPENLRPRDHIAQILRLDEDSVEDELLQAKTAEATLKELKRFYDSAIKPLEILYKYRDLSNRHFGDPEIFSKPLVLFMGPWSGGKSSIINYLLDNEYKRSSLRTGAEPSPAYFNILMWGEREEVLDGTQLAADWTFSGLQKFGQGLLDRLRGLRLNNRLLEKVNIVEIPGILEIRKQVERLFPFNDACQWFIDRADIIFLVYDPAKLDVGPETEAILDQLKGREYQTRIVLNKADQVRPEELMRVQGTLIWNISPLMSSTQPPVMYSTSLWSMPYEIGAPLRLLRAQERAFLRDMREAIDHRVENKIASARRFAVRVRNHAKMVDCYLTTYYNHKSFFGNRKKVADDIIEKPQDYHIYEGLSTLTNISRYDLPDPDTYRDFFRVNPLYEFELLASTCTYFKGCPINRLDVTIAYELPELVGKYKKAAEAAATKVEPKS